MSNISVECAQNDNDVRDALNLACEIFRESSPVESYEVFKQKLWKQDPTYSPNNIILAKNSIGSTVGLVRIVPRKIFRGDEQYDVAGISSVCLRPNERGMGNSIPLMESTLRICAQRNFDFAMLFARHIADHYYVKFGFHGISSYQRLTIRYSQLPAGMRDLQISDFSAKNIDFYDTVYNDCYKDCFGRNARSREYWLFLHENIVHMPLMNFISLSVQGKPVGYAITGPDCIHEIAFLSTVSAAEMVRCLSGLSSDLNNPTQLTFEIPSQHRLISHAKGADLTIASRECPYGGHMVRILNSGSVARKRQHQPGGLSMEVRGKEIWDYDSTCDLLGVHSITDAVCSPKDRLPFNISLPDRF